MTVPNLTLNNGVVIPALGFGVFQTPPKETIAAVETALTTGYRHIDTAAAYGNEREVGEALRRFLGRSGLAREDVFVETKIWISDYCYEQTLHGFDKSARKLGLEQIDLLILHQALPGQFERTIQAYKALETLLADGKVRAIGVSNFMPGHLSRLLADTEVMPAVNQIEVHPYFRQSARLRHRARHPQPGLVAYRRDHLLPGRQQGQHLAGPGDRPDRRGVWQDARPGDAALAPSAGPAGDPEVCDAVADRRKLRHLRIRTER